MLFSRGVQLSKVSKGRGKEKGVSIEIRSDLVEVILFSLFHVCMDLGVPVFKLVLLVISILD